MRRKVRSAVKSPRKSGRKKTATLELSPEEVTHLEQITQRYEQSERAWQLMTAPLAGDETWNHVEEHLLARGGHDQERRWKYFSK